MSNLPALQTNEVELEATSIETDHKYTDVSDYFKDLLVALHADFCECQSRISRILLDEDFLDKDNASDAEISRYTAALLSRL